MRGGHRGERGWATGQVDPEVKQPRARSRNTMSVYPTDMVGNVLGRSSILFNQALSCWAVIMAEATARNAEAFTPVEWEFMLRSARGKTFDPEYSMPGPSVADVVARAHDQLCLGKAYWGPDAKAKVAELAARLRSLDYVRAWAVIWALQWRARAAGTVKRGEPWWTLARRQDLKTDVAPPPPDQSPGHPPPQAGTPPEADGGGMPSPSWPVGPGPDHPE